ncbi:DUF308 domain-containing protein [uncultured Sphaerochaeta sp.]|uniref:HdeD family acid-resistance protein n=1 Tax=uncultured Sphaerochaeta sp. TaxID=886478 RepID=UPI002A0A35B1|nr:DUF308 domain-containing protein [uncultured Sphaerochaeta sp.]
MQDSFLKRHLNIAFAIGIVMAALGLYMMFQSSSFVQVLVTILGVSLVISGGYSLFSQHTYSRGKKSKVLSVVKSLGSIIIGALAVILPFTVAGISWDILIYLLAAQMAISAVVSFLDAFLLRKGEVSVSPILVDGIFSLIFAVLLFIFPRQIGSMVLKIVGFIILASGIGLVVWSSSIRKLANQFKESSVIETTGEIIEETETKPKA